MKPLPIRENPLYLTRSIPLVNVDSFAPAHLAPEGAAFGTLPRGYPRRLGALRADLRSLDAAPLWGQLLVALPSALPSFRFSRLPPRSIVVTENPIARGALLIFE